MGFRCIFYTQYIMQKTSITLFVRVQSNIHTMNGNMTVCDRNGEPYHMGEWNLECQKAF